jgi:hypothetical protein
MPLKLLDGTGTGLADTPSAETPRKETSWTLPV